MRHAVVVGGGVAGLSAAVALSREGVRVTVVEAERRLGGRARSVVDPTTSDTIDIGPHVILDRYPSFRRLLRVLGTEHHVVWQDPPSLTTTHEGKLVRADVADLPPPLHYLPAALRHPRAHLGDIGRNIPAVALALTLDDEDVRALDEVDAETALAALGVPARSRSGLWGFAAQSVLNLPLRECSAGALFRLAGYFLSTRSPCFGLPAVPLGELFAPAAERFVRDAGGTVRVEAKVARVVGHGGTATGVLLEDGSSIAADAVVVAVPPAALAAMVRGVDPSLASLEEQLARFRPVPYASVFLWLDHQLDAPPFWARLHPEDGLGCDFYDLSRFRGGQRSLLAINVIGAPRATELSDEALVDGLVRELAETFRHLSPRHVTHSAVHRIPCAVPAAAPGVERARPPTRTTVQGLFLAGDFTDTKLPFSMESAARSGLTAAEAALAFVHGTMPSLACTVGPREGIARLVHASARLSPVRPSALALRAIERRA